MKLNGPRVMAIFFLLTAASVCLGQTVYEVEGTVYGPDGKVMANVTMSLRNQSGVQIDQDISRTDGKYRFTGVLAGTYYLAVKPPDPAVQPMLQRVELINSGLTSSNSSKERVDFALKNIMTPLAIPGTVFAQAIPPEAEKFYQTAIGQAGKGDKEAAIKDLRKAIEIFPTYFLALQQVGLLYIEVKKDEQAVEPLTKALQVNPKAANAHLGLGMAYVNLDRLEKAVPELNAAITLDSRLFRAYLFLGMAFLTQGRLDESEKFLKQAYSTGGPKQASAAHLYLTSIYNTRQQYQKAIKELEAYLKENPKASNAPKIQEAISKLKAKLK